MDFEGREQPKGEGPKTSAIHPNSVVKLPDLKMVGLPKLSDLMVLKRFSQSSLTQLISLTPTTNYIITAVVTPPPKKNRYLFKPIISHGKGTPNATPKNNGG